MKSITTDSGTTVSIEEDAGLTLVILTATGAPPHLRRVEVGRVVDGGAFQVVPFMPFALSPGVLRAIADLVDTEPSAVERVAEHLYETADPADKEHYRDASHDLVAHSWCELAPVWRRRWIERAQALADAGFLAPAPQPAADTEREVKARALREAALEMDNTDDPDAIHVSDGDIHLWLEARADRIERGEEA